MKWAVNGIDGLRLWREFSPDVVILDVLMPGLSGPEVIHARGPSTAKVILISAYPGPSDLLDQNQWGADAFVSKPFADVQRVILMAEEVVA